MLRVGKVRRPYQMLGMKPGSLACKARGLSSVLLIKPQDFVVVVNDFWSFLRGHTKGLEANLLALSLGHV